jgi:hypothetical protein
MLVDQQSAIQVADCLHDVLVQIGWFNLVGRAHHDVLA